MQTRKRAKSVMFGKKPKEKKEEIIEEAPKEKIASAEHEKISEKAAEKTAEKAEIVERRVVPEKPQVDELSSTLPHTEEKTEKEEVEVATPSNEFVSDNPPESSHEETKEDEQEDNEEPIKTQQVSENPPIEEPASVEVPEETPTPVATPPSQQPESQELSSTLPPSAFTIQEGDTTPIESKPEVEKKRVGVYFFVIAFLAFILGLGAMAAISYFGLINPNMTKLSTDVHMPAFLGSKPTPTVMPTSTPAPTEKPVDLQAYTISVLNGSGVTGEAGKTESSLNSAGFKVASTGNADKSDYTKTEISAKKSVDQAYLSKLEDELNKSFTVDTTVGTSEDSSSSDVTIIIGTQTAQ